MKPEEMHVHLRSHIHVREHERGLPKSQLPKSQHRNTRTEPDLFCSATKLVLSEVYTREKNHTPIKVNTTA